MFGASSILPAVGRGLSSPRFHFVLPVGNFPVPLIVDPRDNTKSRLKGGYLIASICQGKGRVNDAGQLLM